MNVELPNDWGAIRRFHHQTNNTGAAFNTMEEEGSLIQNTGTIIESRKMQPSDTRKRKEVSISSSQEESESEPFYHHLGSQKKNAREEEEEEEKTDSRKKITKGPLGPRGIFNAVTHDSPEKGQLKQIVLMHLGKNKKATHHQDKISYSGEKEVAREEDNDLQMEVHCLLSKLPYQKMLSDLFSHNDKEFLSNPNIPYVTRGYEETFMREPLNSTERLCAKGEQCECMFIDAENPFVSVEFLLPGEKQPSTPHLCVVCCRAVTQQLYYDIMFDKHDFGGVIQRFGNIHSQPGEYALDAMLIAAPNVALHIMPLPIVSHQRNRYSVFVKRGIKHLKQSRVYFQNTPSC